MSDVLSTKELNDLTQKLEHLCGLLDEGAAPDYVVDFEDEVYYALTPHRLRWLVRAALDGTMLRDAVNEYDYMQRECHNEGERELSWQAVIAALSTD